MRKPNWQPPAMIPFFVNLSQEMLDSSKDQLINMKEVKGKPYLLSDNEIERCLKLYREMNEDIPVFLEQCKRWLQLSITISQRKQVLKIEAITKERHDVNEQILSLVKKYLEDQAVKAKPVATYLDQPSPPGVSRVNVRY